MCFVVGKCKYFIHNSVSKYNRHILYRQW